jgi:uncharacterized coiled-coil DUF342 family protein
LTYADGEKELYDRITDHDESIDNLLYEIEGERACRDEHWDAVQVIRPDPSAGPPWDDEEKALYDRILDHDAEVDKLLDAIEGVRDCRNELWDKIHALTDGDEDSTTADLNAALMT